jgi:hypothetical protein
MTMPEKPTTTEIALHRKGKDIKGIILDYKQTGSESAETFATFIYSDGSKITGKWYTWKPYIDLTPDWRSIAQLKDNTYQKVQAWLEWEKSNEAEYKQYLELKKKFEG